MDHEIYERDTKDVLAILKEKGKIQWYDNAMVDVLQRLDTSCPTKADYIEKLVEAGYSQFMIGVIMGIKISIQLQSTLYEDEIDSRMSGSEKHE